MQLLMTQVFQSIYLLCICVLCIYKRFQIIDYTLNNVLYMFKLCVNKEKHDMYDP